MKRITIIASALFAASVVGQPHLAVEIPGARPAHGVTKDVPTLPEGLALRPSLDTGAYRAGDTMVVACSLSNVTAATLILPGASFGDAYQFHYLNRDVFADSHLQSAHPPVRPPITLAPGASVCISNTYAVPGGFDLSAWREDREQRGVLRARLAASIHPHSMSPGEGSRLLDEAYPTNLPPRFDFWTLLNVSTASGGNTNFVTAWLKWQGIAIREETAQAQPAGHVAGARTQGPGVRRDEGRRGETPMTNEFHYTTFIAKPAEDVWAALTEKQMVDQYYLAPLQALELRAGGEIRYGQEAADIFGKVIAVEAPKKLVHSFNFRDSTDPETTVSYAIRAIGSSMCSLTISHTGFPGPNQTFGHVSGGWPVIASSLKTLLETGHSLPWPKQ